MQLYNHKHKVKQLQSRLYKARVDIVLVFVLTFAVAVYWQFTQSIGDPDGFYHAKMALLLSEGNVIKEMPWMQFSTLRDSFTDHHFLYHVLLIPFVKLGNPLLGVKLAQAFFGAGFFTSFYWMLRRLNSHAPFVYTFILLITSSFTFRLGLVKANAIALIVLMAILWALFERRWWWLLILNTVFVWMYGGWPIAWVLAFLFVVTGWAHQFVHFRKDAWFKKLFRSRATEKYWPAVAATAGGSLIGLVVNPYWPGDIYFYWQQIWQIAIVNMSSLVNVGGEWRNLQFAEVLQFYSLIAVLYIVALLLIIRKPSKARHMTWTLLFASLLSIIFTIKSRRYIELSAPLALIFSALVWSDVFPKRIMKDLWQSWKTPAKSIKQLFVLSLIIGGFVFLFLPNVGISQIIKTHLQLKNGVPFNRYSAVSEWLRENTPAGSVVVQSDWDDWPILFYQNTHNYYIIGLDPTFMYNYDDLLYNKWADLTARGRAENVREFIEEDLRAQYVMVEKEKQAMQSLFSNNVYFRLVHEDDEAWLYKLVDSE